MALANNDRAYYLFKLAIRILAHTLLLIKKNVTLMLQLFTFLTESNGSKLVPGGGIEPPRCHQRGILNPVRLPIPPSRLNSEYTLLYNCNGAIIASSLLYANLKITLTLKLL